MIRYLIFKIQLIGHWWKVRWFMLSNLISPPQKKETILLLHVGWMDLKIFVWKGMCAFFRIAILLHGHWRIVPIVGCKLELIR